MTDEMSLEQKIDALAVKLDAVDRKVDAVDRKVQALDGKVQALDGRVVSVERGVGALAVGLEAARADIRLVAEGVDATSKRLDRNAAEARQHHDAQYLLLGQVMRHVRTRVERLESGKRR